MADNKEHICDLCHKRYATGYVMMGTGGHQIVKWLCPECAKQVNAGGGFFAEHILAVTHKVNGNHAV